ncbi:MAG TPA: hypothetical protein VM869_13855 [Enhygromyxa sp.]|nr:hypothetical protein [Enhygromyxa sp.]
MSTVGLTLASLLAFAPPPASDAPADPVTIEAPAPEPAPAPAPEAPVAAPEAPAAAPEAPAAEAPVIVVTPAPAPAPAAPPPAIPNWGPQADVVVSEPSPARPQPIAPPPRPYQVPRKPMMGIGLLVGSSVAFSVGLGARLGQVDVAMNNCRRWSDAGFASLTRCFDYYDSPGTDSNDVFVGAAYGSSIVLTVIGAGALGQHNAWQSIYGDLRSRNYVARVAFGAMFTGLGIASIAAHYALIYADANNPCTSWECNVQRRALWIAASDGGALMLNTGFGMFSFASHYRTNRERYQGMHWSVVPGATRGSVGATATLRF